MPRAVNPAVARSHRVESGRVKVHLVHRDPRDTILSMLDEAARVPSKNKVRSVDDAIARVRPRLERLRCWCAYPSLPLFYENVAIDRIASPKSIAQDLGMTVDPGEVWKLLEHRHTRKNAARPKRHRADLSKAEAERIADSFPGYLAYLDRGDRSWLGASR